MILVGCVLLDLGLGVFGVFFFFITVEVINKTHEKEHGEGDNEEVDHVLDKIANCNMSGGVSTEEIRNVN